MRAVRGTGAGIEVVEVAPPQGDGVRVRVRSAGICGSDLRLISTPFAAGRILGHEVAGTLTDGTPVVVEPVSPCAGCELCRRGDYNLCPKAGQSILGVGRDGGMAEELLAPPESIVPIPTGLAIEDACLVEPVAVAVHGLRRVRFSGSQRVAVIGGGSIGLCAVAAARSAGAEVGLEARHDAQREAGAQLGAVGIRGSYDLVVEAAGSESALARGVELCRPGGTLLLLATYWSGLTLPGLALSLKEVSVVPASMVGREGAVRDIEVATALLARRPEIGRTLIRHRFPIEAAVEAFATAADRSAGAIKVVLEAP